MRPVPYRPVLVLADAFTRRMREQPAIRTFYQQVRLMTGNNQPARRTVFSGLVVHAAIFTQVRIAPSIELVLANLVERSTLPLRLRTGRAPQAVRAPPLMSILLRQGRP